MKYKMRILNLSNPEELNLEMKRIKVSTQGCEAMEDKGFAYALKIENVKLGAANILKQEMLVIGGDAAINRDVIIGKVEYSDVILLGTRKQLLILAKRIRKQQFFDLIEIAEQIEKLLNPFPLPDLVCGDYTLKLNERVHIMGVLNVTPDSFSDGGKFLLPCVAVEQAKLMREQGADIIDVGGESSRPGAAPVSEEEEKRRVLSIVNILVKELDCPISIDTYKSNVAEEALKLGASIVNDISALRFDNRMAEVVAKYDVPLILMHIQGTPRDMQKNPYYDDLMGEIYQFLYNAIAFAEKSGIASEKIIIDPGIGFGKRIEDNLIILRRLRELTSLNKPILIGASRKAFIGKTLDLDVDERLEGTLAAIAIAVMNGANLIRVHDVQATVRLVRMLEAIGKSQ